MDAFNTAAAVSAAATRCISGMLKRGSCLTLSNHISLLCTPGFRIERNLVFLLFLMWKSVILKAVATHGGPVGTGAVLPAPAAGFGTRGELAAEPALPKTSATAAAGRSAGVSPKHSTNVTTSF